MTIEVVSWGIAGSAVDGGRAGRASLGAARGGAVDSSAFALANRIVGNELGATCFETSGGLHLRALRPVMVAVTGAVADIEVRHGPPVGWGTPTVLPAGADLRVGRLLEGARCYVAVRTAGATGAAATEPVPHRPPADELRIWPGPRFDRFVLDAWGTLTSSGYRVVATSRVGVRLDGPPLERVITDELPSEGLIEGAVQVPPDGMPMIMLADHPTTGGYPVVAVVDPADLSVAAQAAPGTTVRFRGVPSATNPKRHAKHSDGR